MRNLLLLFPITLFSFQPIFAQSNIGTMTVYENGTSKTVQYDNTYPQCFTYRVIHFFKISCMLIIQCHLV